MAQAIIGIWLCVKQLLKSPIFHKFEIVAGFLVMKCFGAVHHFPDSRIDRREEGVCLFYGGVDVCHYQTVCHRHCLGVYLSTSDHEGAWGWRRPGLARRDSWRERHDIRRTRHGRRVTRSSRRRGRHDRRVPPLRQSIGLLQRRCHLNSFRSIEATAGNDNVQTFRERTADGLECLSSHDDRASHRRPFEKLEVLGNMPQESVVLSYGIIVGYRHYNTFFHS